MNETSPEIYFQLTPVWQVVAVLCALLLALGFWSYRRAGKLSSSRQVLLWCLRVASVGLVLFFSFWYGTAQWNENRGVRFDRVTSKRRDVIGCAS